MAAFIVQAKPLWPNTGRGTHDSLWEKNIKEMQDYSCWYLMNRYTEAVFQKGKS